MGVTSLYTWPPLIYGPNAAPKVRNASDPGPSIGLSFQDTKPWPTIREAINIVICIMDIGTVKLKNAFRYSESRFSPHGSTQHGQQIKQQTRPGVSDGSVATNSPLQLTYCA